MLDTATPLILSPADNVAIVTARAPQGSRPLGLGVELAAPVMPGHKIAREDIPEGGAISGIAARAAARSAPSW